MKKGYSFVIAVLFSLIVTLPLPRMADSATVGVYIIKAITSQKVLPTTNPSSFPLAGAASDTTIKVSACRGEFEPASFVIRANSAVSNLTMTASNLTGPNGAIIPSSAVDIRLVKCWYQAGSNSILKDQKTLTPELLLKDDSLVKVDYIKAMNYLKVSLSGKDQYIDITSSTAVFPITAIVRDAVALLPFDIQANTNKQVWLTFHIPEIAKSGAYTGSLSFKTGTTSIGTITISLTVLPFDLEKPVIDYGLFYMPLINNNETRITSLSKTEKQYALELQNMKDHGVSYPTWYESISTFEKAAGIRKTVGLPTDKIYTLTPNTGTPTSSTGLTNAIKQYKAMMGKYGYKEFYIYGKDEATGQDLLNQRTAWQVVHNAGAKVFVACYQGASTVVGDVLDTPILSGKYDPSEVAKWHNYGKKVFIYGNPQVGVENADLYRRNYGIAVLCNGYDGVMNFAYQNAFENTKGGSIWNDFDGNSQYRDHVFAYPTSDGIIDTIQWEGFREAVDDVRYLTTLAKVADITVYQSVCSSLSVNNDLNIVRKNIIDMIISKTSSQR